MEQSSVFTEITFWNMLNIFLWLLSGRVWSWVDKLAGKSTVVQMWRMLKCDTVSHIIVNFSVRETKKLKIKIHTCFESTNHTDAIYLKNKSILSAWFEILLHFVHSHVHEAMLQHYRDIAGRRTWCSEHKDTVL